MGGTSTMAGSFGQKMKVLRERAGLSQQQLATAAGLSVSSVSKMEQRDLDPSWSTVQAIAKALGVGVEVFTADDEPAGPDDEPPARPMGKRK